MVSQVKRRVLTSDQRAMIKAYQLRQQHGFNGETGHEAAIRIGCSRGSLYYRSINSWAVQRRHAAVRAREDRIIEWYRAHQALGTWKQLAYRLNVNPRTLRNNLKELKLQGRLVGIIPRGMMDYNDVAKATFWETLSMGRQQQ